MGDLMFGCWDGFVAVIKILDIDANDEEAQSDVIDSIRKSKKGYRSIALLRLPNPPKHLTICRRTVRVTTDISIRDRIMTVVAWLPV